MPTTALSVELAAAELGVAPGEVRAWIKVGAPVAHPGGRGRGNQTLVCVQALRQWRAASADTRQLMELAELLPQVLAEAIAESHTKAEGISKQALARILVGTWYVAATKSLDALRERAPEVPEISALPGPIARLRRIAG